MYANNYAYVHKLSKTRKLGLLAETAFHMLRVASIVTLTTTGREELLDPSTLPREVESLQMMHYLIKSEVLHFQGELSWLFHGLYQIFHFLDQVNLHGIHVELVGR